MAKLSIQAGSVSQSITLFVQDSTNTQGAGLAGISSASTGFTAYYTFSGVNAGPVPIAIASLTGVSASYISGGWFSVSNTTPTQGMYRFDVPNAALATGKGRVVSVIFAGAANMAPNVSEIELTGWDNQSATVTANMVQVLGSTVTTGAAQIGVNVFNINNQAASAVTGVTFPTFIASPTNITGATGIDITKILGTAISTPAIAGILDVNVKNINSVTAATPGASGGILIAGQNSSATITITGALTGSVGSVAGNIGGNVVGNVNGSVASVAGNVGGSVASVVGAVGSVVGNVGGNVLGTVTAAIVSDKTGYSLTSAEEAAIADTLLNRDMATGADTNTHSPRNALRFLRNTWTISGAVVTITKEDQTTPAWTGNLGTTTGALPITSNTTV